eukprot:11469773-Alexandrium_andersonii.AAC.1
MSAGASTPGRLPRSSSRGAEAGWGPGQRRPRPCDGLARRLAPGAPAATRRAEWPVPAAVQRVLVPGRVAAAAAGRTAAWGAAGGQGALEGR